MINLEAYYSLKEEAQERQEKAWQEYIKASDLEKDILIQLVDLKGKYIKVNDSDGLKYIFVTEEFECEHNDNSVILLRGLGFFFNFSMYWDATYMSWGRDMETYIKFDNFDEDCSSITEITEEEFNKAFYDMIEKAKEFHIKYCE